MQSARDSRAREAVRQRIERLAQTEIPPLLRPILPSLILMANRKIDSLTEREIREFIDIAIDELEEILAAIENP